jgi:hypothetical protein
VIDREADLALQVDGQASVVHRGLPGDRLEGGNAYLGRGHERLEEVDAEPFADAVERLEVNEVFSTDWRLTPSYGTEAAARRRGRCVAA